MTIEMWLIVVVIIVPLLLVLGNRWRVDIAAFFIIVVLGLAQYLGFGILAGQKSPQQTILAISGFGQPVVVTLIGLFILTQALTNNGVMLWLGQRLIISAERSVTRLIFIYTLLAALLSLLMNNIVVGALLLPSAMQVSHNARIRPSKLLLPIAFGTALGGMATYFTTANIVMSNLLSIANPPQTPLGVLSFTATGGLIAIAGIMYITIFGRRLVPARQPGPEQALARRASVELESIYEVGERLWEAQVKTESALAGLTLQECAIGRKLGIAIVAMRRGYQAFFAPLPDEIIHRGDILLIVGREDRVLKLNDLGFNVEPELHTITTFGMTLIELILAPHSSYAGKSIKQMNFRRKYGFTILAILRAGRRYRTDVGDIPLELGDSLLIVGPPNRVRDLRVNPDIILFEPDPATRAIPWRRAVISVLVFASAIVFSLVGFPVYLSVLASALMAILLGLLPIQEAYRSVEWQVIFFIAGMYVASLGMVNTGLAALIGQNVFFLLRNTGPLGLAAASFLISSAFTQLMGSQATAFVIGPVAISAAIHFNTNPHAIAVASAIGCSASFLTPIAHPVNLIMMGPGNYRFGDFFRVGIGLMIVVFLCLLVGMVLFWKL
jgi:di/tricarboxylate transporter